jgi:ascorbate PTS system EIIB component
MRILAVCGMGLGSSLILKINIQKALQELGVTGAEIEHCDLNSLAFEKADLIVVTRDLQASCESYGTVIALSNVMNKAELKTLLAEALLPKRGQDSFPPQKRES